MQLVPKDVVAKEDSKPLVIDEKKQAEMLAKAEELLTKAMEAKDLMDALEHYYIFELNEHYTSDQLKGAVDALYLKLNPPPEPEVVAEEFLPKV